MVEVMVLGASAVDPPPGLPESTTGAQYTFADDEAALIRALPRTDVIFHWADRSDVLRAHWSEAKRLAWIHAAGVGVEWSLFPELVDNDVVLTNCRGVFDTSMPEYALALLLALAKDIAGTLDAQRERAWRHRPLRPLAGTHAVVLGAGSIGLATARLLAAVGARVTLVASRARPAPDGLGPIRSVDDLPQLVAGADHLVVVLPLTDETRDVVSAEVLAAVRPGTFLVNIGRGATIDEAALLGALRDGRIGAAALDVFEREPLPPDHPFWAMPNVIVSPHIGGDVPGWLGWFVDRFVANLERFIAGEPLHDVVDKRLGYVPTPTEAVAR